MRAIPPEFCSMVANDAGGSDRVSCVGDDGIVAAFVAVGDVGRLFRHH